MYNDDVDVLLVLGLRFRSCWLIIVARELQMKKLLHNIKYKVLYMVYKGVNSIVTTNVKHISNS